MRAPAALLGIGTAVPQYRVPQATASRFVVDRLGADSDATRFAQRVFSQAAVATRYSCVPDFGGGSSGLFSVPRPGTAARMSAYREHAVPLAATAARRALASARMDAEQITHLVVVSCTGFFAPGPDVDLVEALGLRRDVARTIVGFMGCYAAFNGLRVAADAARAHPRARVLVVCVELCTLHFRHDPAPDNLVSQALFGDGAGAVVVGCDADPRAALLHLGDEATWIADDSEREMAWQIGDDGFAMRLSASVPERLADLLPRFLERLVPATAYGSVAAWCVHPGGRAILDRIEQRLALPETALASSRSVLRDVGNVSSASVLFVLERSLAHLHAGERGVLLGFGPGLTLEARTFVGTGRARVVPASGRAPADCEVVLEPGA